MCRVGRVLTSAPDFQTSQDQGHSYSIWEPFNLRYTHPEEQKPRGDIDTIDELRGQKRSWAHLVGSRHAVVYSLSDNVWIERSKRMSPMVIRKGSESFKLYKTGR